MTREQARALLMHLDLVRHYADGGDVGHRLIDANGKTHGIYVSRGLNLSSLSPDRQCLYVALRPRYVIGPSGLVRSPRGRNTKVRERDVIVFEPKEGKPCST